MRDTGFQIVQYVHGIDNDMRAHVENKLCLLYVSMHFMYDAMLT